MNTPYKLTKEELEIIARVAEDGAKHASESLSKLIAQDIAIEALEVRAIPVEEVHPVIGSPTDKATFVMMGISGEASGNMLLVYPQKSALVMADLLLKRQLGTTVQLDELDTSAIKESANIITGAVLSLLSTCLHINMIGDVPSFVEDTLWTVTDEFLIKFIGAGMNRSVALEIDFKINTVPAMPDPIRAHLILIFDVRSVEMMLTALQSAVGNRSPS